MRPYLEKKQKRASRVAQGIDPEFKSQYRKKIPVFSGMLQEKICIHRTLSTMVISQ
jgi:hypothetical protein